MATTITERDLAATILNLVRAGKRMPQDNQLKGAANVEAETQRILRETVAVFKHVFFWQHIGIERWQEAEHIALTMTSADQLNVNIITPALMQAALNKAEQEHIARQTAKNEQGKLAEPVAEPIAKMLWHWTMAKLREGRAIMPYMPDEAAVTGYMMKLKLNRDEQVKYRQLIRAYINDCIFAKKESKPVASKLFFYQQTRDIKLEILI